MIDNKVAFPGLDRQAVRARRTDRRPVLRWSVSIVADAAHSSFGRSAMIGAFNAGAGILGFPTGGRLSDVAVRRGIGRKPLVVGFTAIQCVLTVVFGFVVAAGSASVWVMARCSSTRA
jgi:ACS family D-galactonate transporter-like MFS transporter